MSQAGNCDDTAPVELFWGTLTTEIMYHRWFATRHEGTRAAFKDLEMFYNHEMLHAALG